MSGLTDLTFEDEQNDIYEEYLVYIIPFKWWNENKDNFPILVKLFMCFSYICNLKPRQVGKMAFLKRNLKMVK